MAIDWGSVADWVAGVGAVSALIFARSASVSARRASDLQAKQIDKLEVEDRKREDRRRREMASKVAVYVGITTTEGGPQPVVRFVNSGDLPIYGLTIFAWTPTVILRRRYFVNGPQLERRTLSTLTGALTKKVGDADPRPMVGGGQLVAACSFTDAAGASWYRAPLGTLHETSDERSALAAALASGPDPSLPVEEVDL